MNAAEAYDHWLKRVNDAEAFSEQDQKALRDLLHAPELLRAVKTAFQETAQIQIAVQQFIPSSQEKVCELVFMQGKINGALRFLQLLLSLTAQPEKEEEKVSNE